MRPNGYVVMQYILSLYSRAEDGKFVKTYYLFLHILNDELRA